MNRKHINWKRILLQLLKTLAVVGFSFLIVWGYAQIALNLSFLNPITEAVDNISFTDKYYQMREAKESRLVTLVDLTELYDRGEIAQAIEDIEACRPAVIGLDCVFEGEKPDVRADNAVRNVAKRYDNIVFSYKLLDEQDDGTGYSRSIHSFFTDEMPVHEGVTNMKRDNLYNNIKRTLQLGWLLNGKKELSLVGEVVNLYAGSEIVTAKHDDEKINFSPTVFTKVKPSEVFQHREQIEGRIVLFGALADETDMHYTPLGKMAGVELLAYATQTLLENKEIIKPSLWMQVLISILLVIMTNILQVTYLGWTSRSKSPIVFHVMGSTYVLGLVTFMWIALIVWIAFLCFGLYHVSIELKWTIAAMAFLSMSRSTYAACEEYFKIWQERKQKKT